MKELRLLARFVEQFRYEQVEPAVQEAARFCILDTIGLALGAKNDSMFRNIKQVYAEFDGDYQLKRTTMWGEEEQTTLRTTVFLNAMKGHILELDDVHITSKTHIGTVVVPAVWGLAEQLGKGGKAVLEAVICGYEVMARVGMGFGVSSHRNKGWHVTGTAGVFGATAACAKLLQFTEDQIMDAFGLAGTQAGSTWAFLADGATNKILHPGRAAVNGLESCMLVKGGMRGSHYILNAKDGGLFPMMSDEYDYSLLYKGVGENYEILSVDKKPYPCCRSTHCAIDAAIQLKGTYQIKIEQIDTILIKTYLVGWKQCGKANSSLYPQLPTNAKFSTPYTVACALAAGAVGLGDFVPEAISRADVRALMKRVRVIADETYTKRYPEHWGCGMEIQMKNGRWYQIEVKDASGSVDAPLTTKQILAKARSCCKDYNQNWINFVLEQLLKLEQCEVLPTLRQLN